MVDTYVNICKYMEKKPVPWIFLYAFGTLDQPPWSKIRGGGSRFDWNFPVKQPEEPLAVSP